MCQLMLTKIKKYTINYGLLIFLIVKIKMELVPVILKSFGI